MPFEIGPSFPLYLLKALREAGTEWRTIEQLIERAHGLLREDYEDSDRIADRFAMERDGADRMLRDFAQLGIVRREGGEPPRYRGSFGNGPPGDGPGGGGRDGDDGGSGMGEVLRSPILFAMDKQDFAAAVARSLEIY
ncbi:MAG: hypothetical protein M3Z20_19350 [Chloroflexota bacterium]|nr:hypothetical protein [Chloroflexota bacterium]